MPKAHDASTKDTPADAPWWGESATVEEAYNFLRTKPVSEIINIWRTTLVVGGVEDSDFSLVQIVTRAVNLLDERQPDLYRAVLIAGTSDSHTTLQDMCQDELGMAIQKRADREVEQLLIGLLSQESWTARHKAFDTLRSSLSRVERPLAEGMELARRLEPFAAQFLDN